MKSIMKVIILQTDICWANPATNQKHIEKMMEAHTGADLYVLPEMFSTGFCTQPEGVQRRNASHFDGWSNKQGNANALLPEA